LIVSFKFAYIEQMSYHYRLMHPYTEIRCLNHCGLPPLSRMGVTCSNLHEKHNSCRSGWDREVQPCRFSMNITGTLGQRGPSGLKLEDGGSILCFRLAVESDWKNSGLPSIQENRRWSCVTCSGVCSLSTNPGVT
jgi:hypothetical protein